MKKIRKLLVVTILSLSGLCLVLVAVSAISNHRLPQHSPVVATLSEADKIRLAEIQHLRQMVGGEVWPGWGQADIPFILYNEEYAFLVSYPDPPDGWVKVPQGTRRGGPWELAPNELFFTEPYYRQRLPDPDTTPEAFTVLVGERWAASLQTLDWAKISLVQPIRADLPPFLRLVFPYRLFIGQLVSGSDQYISLAAHEAFHAFQGMSAPDKFASAELAVGEHESQYPWQDPSLQTDWQAELDLLSSALQKSERDEIANLAGRFIDLRASRRERAGLSSGLVAYEKNREWLEGLARYAELEIWRQASGEAYAPSSETSALNDFDGYAGFESRWAREIDQIVRMADDEGDGRFYYSGMAQAFLLDRLMPDWKTKAFENGIWLEDLLEENILR